VSEPVLAQLLAVALEIRDELRKLNGRESPLAPGASPYLTADEAAVYLRFPSVQALRNAIPRVGIPVVRRGRTLLFHRGQLDRWLAGAPRVQLMREARSLGAKP
jgi:excisionase family DNA binding protein